MATLGSTTDIPAHIGIWTNWSRGHIVGTTLTLTHRDGALLTAFLAVFITFVGTSFWRIASFILHQFLSSRRSADGLYHQAQAVLRNSANASAGLIRLLEISWAWRSKTARPLYRMIPLLTAIAISIAAFAVASIFSAQISSAMGDEILISSKLCGLPFNGDPSVVDERMVDTIYRPYNAKQISAYANYVRTCYTNVSHAQGCNSFIKRQLSRITDRNASCPFERSLCRRQDQNIKLDTGYLNINSELGVNFPAHLQSSIRYTLHCAPLATSDYKQVFNFSSDIAYMRLFYGQKHTKNNSEAGSPDYTYEAQIISPSLIISEDFQADSSDYHIG